MWTCSAHGYMVRPPTPAPLAPVRRIGAAPAPVKKQAPVVRDDDQPDPSGTGESGHLWFCQLGSGPPDGLIQDHLAVVATRLCSPRATGFRDLRHTAFRKPLLVPGSAER